MTDIPKLDFMSKITRVQWGGVFVAIFPSVAGPGSYRVTLPGGTAPLVVQHNYEVTKALSFSITFTGDISSNTFDFSVQLFNASTCKVDPSSGSIIDKATGLNASALWGINGPIAIFHGVPQPPLQPGTYKFTVQHRAYHQKLLAWQAWPSGATYLVNEFRKTSAPATPSLPIPSQWQAIFSGPPPQV